MAEPAPATEQNAGRRIEMLRAAAKAFVPANGDPYAMACADYVVRSNEDDAVAHVVELLTQIYRARRQAI